MISYDRYENRIKKVAKIRNFFKKFKFLFIAAFALIAAAIATLLGLKGSFSGAIKISSSVYGDGYNDPSGVTAFLSDVSYEYAQAGSSVWVKEKPVKAGKYEVRAVSDKLAGKGYGKTAAFEITPREVEFSIVSDSVEYGGVPQKISLNLLQGDTLEKDELLFIYDDYVSERTNVDLDDSSVKIVHGADDRTACYNVKHEKKELTIDKCKIDVSLGEQNFVYSGSAISYSKTPSEVTARRLANGDEIRFGAVQLMQGETEISEAVFAGSYKAIAKDFSIYKRIGDDEFDVTSQYDAKNLFVSFTIDRKALTINTNDGEWIYDGTTFTNDGFTAAGLAQGDTFSVTESSSIQDAGERKNEFTSYEIKNASDTPVSRNYNISFVCGTLKVKRRPITVVTGSDEKIYDGTALRVAGVTCTDDKFEVQPVGEAASIVKVGKCDNATDFAIYKKGSSVMESISNFAVTKNWGKLTITPCSIKISIQDLTKEYDGNPLYASPERGEVTVVSGALASGDGLVGNVASDKLKKLTNVQKSGASVVGVRNLSEYQIFCGGDDRTDCYSIDYERGMLTVTPRHITLITNSEAFVYDGQEHSNSGCTIFEGTEEVELIAGNSLSVLSYAKFKTVAQTQNEKNNVCTYSVTENYQIDSVDYGTLKIFARVLRVTSNTNEFVYDGQDHSDKGYTAKYIDEDFNEQEGLLGGDELIINSYKKVRVVGDTRPHNNECDYSVPNDNYEIVSYQSGTLKVNPRPITITTLSKSWVYDGDEHSLPTVSCSDTVFRVEYAGNATVVKNVTNSMITNSVDYLIKNAEGETENKSNFSIMEEFGTLGVTKRTLNVVSSDGKWVYDADTHSLTEVSLTDEVFTVKADETPISTILNFGATPNVVGYTVWKKSTNTQETDLNNFTVNEIWGTLTVLARKLRVVTASGSREYDGTAFEKNEYLNTYPTNAEGDGLLGTDELTLLASPSPAVVNVNDTKAGNNTCTFSVPNANYEIDGYDCGKLTVTPRHITLLTNSETFVYDGQEHSNSGCTIFEGTEEVELIAGNSLTVLSYAKFKNVAQTQNEKNNVCTYSVTNNYHIDSVDYGTLKIFARSLLVTSNTNEFVYDGQEHSDKGYTAKYIDEDFNELEGLLGVDELIINSYATVRVVDDTRPHNNECDYGVPNDNYEIGTLLFGTLTVTPRPICVVTDSGEKVYDGTPLEKNSYVKTYYWDGYLNDKEGLIGTDELKLVRRYEITNVLQSGDNLCEFEAPNNNYDIVMHVRGTLSILPRKLRVVTASDEKEFDGTALERNEYLNAYPTNAEGDGLIGTDELTFLASPSPAVVNVLDTKAGNNTCTFSVPNPNYEIEGYDCGTLTVTKKSVTVKLSDITATYGEDYEIYPTGAGNFANAEDCGFVDTDTVEISVRYVLASDLFVNGRLPVKWDGDEIAAYENAVVFKGALFIGSDEDNYAIEYESASLTISRRILTIEMLSAKTFYGEEIENADGTSAVYPSGVGNVVDVYHHIESGDTDYTPNSGLLSGDTVQIVKVNYLWTKIFNPDISSEDLGLADMQFMFPKNAAKYYIKPYEIRIRDNGAEVVIEDKEDGDALSNYLVRYYIAGMLTVLPRPIEVTLNQIESSCFDGEERTYTAGEEVIVRGSADADTAKYLIKSDALVYGDKLNVSVKFNAKPFLRGTYSYSLDLENCMIREEDGEGGYKDSLLGTGNYEIRCPRDGTFEITPRPVTVQLKDHTCVYGEIKDGTVDGYADDIQTVASVVSELGFVGGGWIDEYQSFDFHCGSKPAVGDYKITAVPSKVTYPLSDEYDNLIDCYEIEVKEGTLTVTEKAVTITAWRLPCKYGDAIDLTTMYTPLAYGETMMIQFAYYQDGAPVTPKDVGVYDVQLIPVLDVGEEGLKNYSITYYKEEAIPDKELEGGFFEGGLVISKLSITVSVTQKDKIVYGESIANAFTTSTDPAVLPYGEVLTNSLTFKKADGTIVDDPKFAGTYVVIIGGLLINDSEEGLKNYDVDQDGELKDGTLVIDRRPLNVQFKELKLKYGDEVKYADGNAKNYVILSGSLVEAYGDELTISPKFVLTGTNALRPDVGSYDIIEDGYVVTSGGQEEIDGYVITNSYDITVSKASLIVEQRIIDLTLNVMSSFYYDGQAHAYVSGGEAIAGDGMATGETLSVAVKFYLGSAEAGEQIGKAGVYTYRFDKANSSVMVDGENKIQNYDITSHDKSCMIFMRLISVTVETLENSVYGTAVTYPDGAGNYASITPYDPLGGTGFLTDETLKIGVEFKNKATGATYQSGEVLPAGDYEVHAVPARCTVTGGAYADFANYNATFFKSEFSISKREITVTLNDVAVDYGETPEYDKDESYQSATNLAGGETLKVVYTKITMPDRAPVGEYAEAVALDPDHAQPVQIMLGGADVTQNYIIKQVKGKLTVNKRRIKLITKGKEFVYDGNAHTFGEFYVEYEKDGAKQFAYDDVGEIAPAYKDNLPFVMEYPESIDNIFDIVIKDAFGNPAMGNYEIYDRSYGVISILQRIIYVETENLEKVYDGTALESKDEIVRCYHYIDNKPENGEAEGLVAGQSFTYKTVSRTNAGRIKNNNIDDIVDGAGNSKKHNYIIMESDFGELTVYPRYIFVLGVDGEKVYDGDPLTSPDNYVVAFFPDNDFEQPYLTGEENVLVSGHSFKTEDPQITDVGEIENNKYVGVTSAAGDVSDNYYIISQSGVLKVTPRPVDVAVGNLNMTYCNAAPSEAPAIEYQKAGEVADRGILAKDEAGFPFLIDYKLNGESVTRFNVGEYAIECASGNDNYQFYTTAGTLTVTQAKLVVRAPNKSEQYSDYNQKIEISRSDITVTGIAAGDVCDLSNLSLNRSQLSVSENKSSVTIKFYGKVVARDGGGNDISQNYSIVYINGTLSFRVRVIRYNQIVPEAMRVLEYTGTKQTIVGANFELLDEMIGEDTAYIKSAYVGKDAGIYTHWLTLTASRSKLYTFVCQNGSESSVRVLEAGVSKSESGASLFAETADSALPASLCAGEAEIFENERIEG